MLEPIARRGFLATVFGALVSPWLPKKKKPVEEFFYPIDWPKTKVVARAAFKSKQLASIELWVSGRARRTWMDGTSEETDDFKRDPEIFANMRKRGIAYHKTIPRSFNRQESDRA